MVENNFITSVLRTLEKYLIRKNNFRLNGINYDLILLVPNESFIPENKFSIILSSSILNEFNQKDLIKEVLNEFVESNKVNEYNSIYRVNILHTNDNLVNSFKPTYSLLGGANYLYQIENISVAGIQIDSAYLVKSILLNKLVEGSATTIRRKDNNDNYGYINAGIIRIDRDFNLVCYSRKGLDEIFRPQNEVEINRSEFLKLQTEEYLLENNYIYKVNIDSLDEF